MASRDELDANEQLEEKHDGSTEYFEEGWDENNGVLDPSENDDDEIEAETITHETDVNELARSDKRIDEEEERT